MMTDCQSNWLFAGLLLLALSAILFFPKRSAAPKDLVEIPHLARVELVPIRCGICNEPVKDQDIIVWFEKKSGWRSHTYHAACSVLIRNPDSPIVRRMDGTVVRTDARGGVMEPLPNGMLFVTQHEWDAWLLTCRNEHLP
jgi:hypothetical protein